MPDKNRRFHEFALRSGLFRGRGDWYFCYLKSERIAHVLQVLALGVPHGLLEEVVARAEAVPSDICRLAAGEFDVATVLADVFGIMALVRIHATRGTLHKEHAALLCSEYEYLAERLVQGSHPSPFGADDFAVPAIGPDTLPTRLPSPPKEVSDIKDIKKTKGHSPIGGVSSGRAGAILDVLKKEKSASIKAIAAVVVGCSEKTIQRELGDLIAQGLVRKIGERRWSVYELATSH